MRGGAREMCGVTSLVQRHRNKEEEARKKKKTHIWRRVQQVGVDHHRGGVGLRREVRITGQRSETLPHIQYLIELPPGEQHYHPANRATIAANRPRTLLTMLQPG